MVKLTTVHQAQKEIERLSSFVKLAENCNPETIEKMMIKEYAYLGSMNKVVKKLNSVGATLNGRQLEAEDVRDVIKAKGNDELHKIVRSGYLYKTRVARRKTRKQPSW